MEPSEARELRQLREENAKLKRIVADLSLDKAMLQDVFQNNSEAGTEEADRAVLNRPIWCRRSSSLRLCPAAPLSVVLPQLPGSSDGSAAV